MYRIHRRPGATKLVWLAFLASAGVLVALVAFMGWDVRKWFAHSEGSRPVVVYCAAALKPAVEEIAADYQKEYGVPIELEFGPTQTLLARMELTKRGDLFLPADDSFHDQARQKNLLAETLLMVGMTPVLAVKKGNPLGIRTLDDLLNSKATISQANPEAAAVGILTRKVLSERGLWDRFKAHLEYTRTSVTDAAKDVVIGAAQAAVVWDATVEQYPELEAVKLPLLTEHAVPISAGVLTTSAQPTAALRFARYLTARDRGLVRFKEKHFFPAEGDKWEETPEVLLYAGAMLQPAIEETLNEFESREGVKVVRIFNGCGILVSQMEVKKPDAFFACDAQFMNLDSVRSKFEPATDVSANQLVILVPKGNPHNIRKLEDLAQKGIRLGVGHEKQCALGVLTQDTLHEAEIAARKFDPKDPLREKIMANVTIQLPTGGLLVNELRLGHLDAAIAYISNAAEAGDALEAFKVNLSCSLATQPIAVGKTSDHKHLTRRLMDALQTAKSRQRFEALGFTWKAAQ